jgi:hypothetical protein
MGEPVKRLRVGMRVHVLWDDITVDVNRDEPLLPAQAESVGWIEVVNKRVLTLTTCRYTEDGCTLRDVISLPRGVVTRVERI